MNILSLFSPIEKLINEHGSAAIQTTHISLLKEQITIIRDALTKLEAQNEVLKSQLTESEKEKDGLKEKYKQLKNGIDDWENIASKYKMTTLGKGNIAYISFPSDANSHYICPSCYEKRKRSILQPTRNDEFWFNAYCHECNYSLSVKLRDEPPLKPIPIRKYG